MSSDIQLFSEEWGNAIEQMFFPNIPKKEAAIFKELCRLRKLNPYTKQVYFMPFKEWEDGRVKSINYSMVVGIDGFRSLAARTGLYAGQDEPVFTYDKNGNLLSCKVAVYRKDVERPTVAIAHYSEYVQTVEDRKTGKRIPNKAWMKPHIMLSKCAEALALRKAFPDDLGGLHEESELGVVVEGEVAQTPIDDAPKQAPKSRTEALLKKLAPKTVDPKDLGRAMVDLIKSATDMDAELDQHPSGGLRNNKFPLRDDPPPPSDVDAPPPEDMPSIQSYAEKVMASLGGKVESSRAEGDYVISFGKYAGKKLSEVDTGWVKWWASNSKSAEERAIANAELQRRET